MKRKTTIILTSALVFGIISCGGDPQPTGDDSAQASPKSMYAEKKEAADPMNNKGIGPVTSLELAEIDDAMAEEGRLIYEEKCTACHKVTERYIGPAPAGIMERRSPEWIMNMILNPEEMVKEDPIAKDLLKEYLSPMANQSLTEEEARKILEYFRTI